MRYWWVNQNQTYRQEVGGGYLWSPKRKQNGQVNPFYEFMREVAPGDLILSFADTRIRAFGIARSHAYEAPKPAEFGSAGRNWDRIGWRVDVGFKEFSFVFRPSAWIEHLRTLLPARYSPLLRDGRGVQAVYLTELSRSLALALADLLGSEVSALARVESVAESMLPLATPEIALWEEHLREAIELDGNIERTEKEALVLARRGQGLFRARVQEFEKRCRVTGVERLEHLRASHIKPWRDSSNDERLTGGNGLLLTPSIDHLFDRGFLSFRGDGRLLVSPVAHAASLQKMGVPIDRDVDVGRFSEQQAGFLEYHRDEVFLRSRKA
ncbi:MAG: HNH endonuclease [Planctomycetes bacterium]|nr:HNH endonuclease [Planctomycetota bacterium]